MGARAPPPAPFHGGYFGRSGVFFSWISFLCVAFATTRSRPSEHGSAHGEGRSCSVTPRRAYTEIFLVGGVMSHFMEMVASF